VISILAGLILILNAGPAGVLAVAWIIGVLGVLLSIVLTFLSLKFRGMQVHLRK
jgi:NADH:ubiquinone oxidoreductase subunit 6 (subunit J)